MTLSDTEKYGLTLLPFPDRRDISFVVPQGFASNAATIRGGQSA